jgi:hypothetical protein
LRNRLTMVSLRFCCLTIPQRNLPQNLDSQNSQKLPTNGCNDTTITQLLLTLKSNSPITQHNNIATIIQLLLSLKTPQSLLINPCNNTTITQLLSSLKTPQNLLSNPCNNTTVTQLLNLKPPQKLSINPCNNTTQTTSYKVLFFGRYGEGGGV